jgi:hypothetical protein
MKTLMNDTQLETLDQIRQFPEGNETVRFQIESKKARYRRLQHTLNKFRYLQLSKTEKGLLTLSMPLMRSPNLRGCVL